MRFDLDQSVTAAIERHVRSGEFANAGEVLAEAIRLLDEQAKDGGYARARLARQIQDGLDDLTLGRTIAGEIVFASLVRRAKAMRDEE